MRRTSSRFAVAGSALMRPSLIRAVTVRARRPHGSLGGTGTSGWRSLKSLARILHKRRGFVNNAPAGAAPAPPAGSGPPRPPTARAGPTPLGEGRLLDLHMGIVHHRKIGLAADDVCRLAQDRIGLSPPAS